MSEESPNVAQKRAKMGQRGPKVRKCMSSYRAGFEHFWKTLKHHDLIVIWKYKNNVKSVK